MKNQLQHLLEKYLKGDCTPEEEAAVMEWYNAFADDDDYISSLSGLQKNVIQEKLKKNIDANIQLQESQTGSVKKPLWRYLGYAVTGIAAMLLLAYGLNILNSNNSGSHVTVKSIDKISLSNTTKTINEFILSDGSHVWLYPGAKIEYSKKFTGATREVKLTGESFFDVAKDAAHPFIIYSNRMITKVWGTSFKVSDVPGHVSANVQVVTGKVSVKPTETITGQAEVMLHPHEQVTYRPEQKILQQTKIQSTAKLAIWNKVDLEFDNKPISEVIPVLNKYFNVKIKVEDTKLNGYLLNADFDGLNFVSIMQILNKTLNISYEISGTDITLKNNN